MNILCRKTSTNSITKRNLETLFIALFYDIRIAFYANV